MKKSYQLLCLVLALLTFSSKSFSQNNLAAGDLAIVSYQSDFDPTNAFTPGVPEFEDRFSLAVLRPGGLAAGTVIFFTTRGWNGPANTWHDEDYTPFTFGIGRRAVVQWTVPAGGIAQGTEVFFINTYHDELPAGSEYYSWAAYSNEAGTILLNNLTNVTPIVPGANTTDGMSFAVSGDKLLVYQTGPVAGPTGGFNGTPIRFITALLANVNGTTVVAGTTTYATWDAVPGAMASNESSVPPGLVNGQTCFLMSPSTMPNISNGTTEPDNGKFSACALSSAGACTALQMSTIIYTTNPAGTPTTPNWTYSNTVFPLGTSSSLCTYNVLGANTITLTSAAGTNAQTKCINTAITNITYSTTGATGATFSGLPAGVTGSWAANVVTISGSPTTTVGSPFGYTVTLTGGCGTVTATGTITVTPNNTVTLTSAAGTNAQTVCINTAITNITYSTTGATGATFSGLPAGVTGNWAANVVTISGSPTTTVGSPFSYTVTLTGGCGAITATGSITVSSINTVTLTSSVGTDNQSVGVNTPITNITYGTTGATGATFSGLPAGVTGGWAANVATISGSPTTAVGSPFNYTVTLTGGCGTVTATGTITVSACGATLTSAAGTNAQQACINNPITNITYSTSVATGATFAGLPAGVTGNWAANVITISGTPTTTVGSPFSYTVTLTGGTCSGQTVTGTITVNALPVVSITGPNSICAACPSGPGTTIYTANLNGPAESPSNASLGTGTATITINTVTNTMRVQCTFSGLTGITTASHIHSATAVANTGTAGVATTTPTFTAFPLGVTSGTYDVTFDMTLASSYNPAYVTANGGTTASAFAALQAGLDANKAYFNIHTSTFAGGEIRGFLNTFCSSANSSTTLSPTSGGTWISSNPTVATVTNAGVVNGVSTGTATFTYTNTGTTCSATTASVTVSPSNTVTPASSTPTVCLNTPLTNITHTTTGATGISAALGLPAGVTAAWAANTLTISGTPTASGVFNYTIPLTGGCGGIAATGTITVTPNNTITLTSAAGTNAQTACINTAITNITYSTTGATGATFGGLPAGVTGNWAANLVTISGTPTTTVGSPFNYTVTLTGGCGTITASGTISVSPNNTVTLTSGAGTNNQTIVVNQAMTTPITYSTTGATGATFSGLPPGVTGAWASNVITISGTPTTTVGSPFNYTVTLTGGCGTITATGTLTVVACSINLTSAAGTNAQTVCNNSPITNITYSTTGATGATFAGLPAGVTGNWAANIVTISGTPTASGTFNYTVTLTGGGCGAFTATGTITVNPIPDVNQPGNQIVCNTGATTTVTFTGSVPGTIFNWTNNTTSIGLAAIGTGNISSFTATNATNAPVVGTITVTPTTSPADQSQTSSTTCMTVFNQTDLAQSFKPSASTLCGARVYIASGSGTGDITIQLYSNLPNAAGVLLAQGTATGIGASQWALVSWPSVAVTPGTTYYLVFTSTNGTLCVGGDTGNPYPNGQVYANAGFQPFPTFDYTFETVSCNGTPCTGAPKTFTITVNPTPTAVATPASQTVCSGTAIGTIALSGAVSGTTFNWTRDNTVAVTGIAASGAGNISGTLTNTTSAPVTVTFTITPTANGCPGTPITATVLVNPTPNAVATPASQTICSAATITTIALTGNVAGTVFNWTRDMPGVTGIAASGAGNISGSLTNTTNAPVTVTFTITPTANGCPGAPITATVLVNPIPNAVATPASQTICSANAITTIVNTGNVAGTVFNWTRNNTVTVTGIAASGAGNISGSLTNTTNAPVTVTFTITPTANGCPGAPITATVLVNPTPNAVATPSTQSICNASAITPIVLTGGVAGTTFAWTRDNNATVTGIAANGTGTPITGTLTNTTTAPVTVTFTITPTANGCPGPSTTATVIVQPTATVDQPANQTVCTGTPTAAVNFTSPVTGVTYNWTNNTTSIGLAASGTGNIPSFVATNATLVPVTATITVTPSVTIPGGLCGMSAPQTFTNSTPVAISNGAASVVSSTVVVSGAPTYLYNLNVLTNITHTFNADLDITIMSPAGTIVTLTSDNGGANDNVFNGTLWNDKANPAGQVPYTTNNGVATDHVYVNLTAATPLVAEEALGAFIGENPNGTWTITVSDDLAGDGGSLDSWSLIVSGLSAPPTLASSSYSNNTPVVISTGVASVITSTINVSGAGTVLHDVDVTTFIKHTFASDLDVTITSPAGTVVTLTTDNGGANDDVYNGTVWNDKANPGGQVPYVNNNGLVTDHLYVNNTLASPLVPEEALAAFIGENPNGTWTLTISDDAAGDGGSLDSWSLDLQTASCPIICTGTPKTFTITVNPLPTITCPANITTASDVGVCNKTVNYTPTVTGTPVPTLSYVLTGATTGSGAGSGSGLKFNVGVTTVTVTATNTCATVSCSFTITVTDSQLPTITTQPANRTVCAGSNATFTVVAVTAPSAGGPIAYQWQLWNGSTWNNIAGATAATLTLNSVTQTMNTNSYRVVLTGLCTTVTSGFATLYVNPLPTINLTTSIPPALLPTQVLTITATTAPSGGSYVWFKNGVVIPGATGNTLSGLTVSDIGTYRVVYTDGNGCVATSANIDVTGQPSDNLYVYPVPNQGVFNVRFYNQANEQVTVRVFDAKGAEVYSRKVLTTIPYTTINVDLSTSRLLANGTYIVDVRGADGRLMGSRKIIVYNR